MIDQGTLRIWAVTFMEEPGQNQVRAAEALRPDLAGMRLFDAPLLGVASACDPLFARLAEPGVIGPHFRPPASWLPEARSVLSLFLPLTEQIRVANRPANCTPPGSPAAEWLHGRIEGQAFQNALAAHLAEKLRQAGHKAVIPGQDPRFRSRTLQHKTGAATELPGFTSNWSERHVAHVAGLGTLSLCAGLITERGMAGRLISLVTDLAVSPTPRPYAGHDAWCTHCGACARHCPAGAISPNGKAHPPCSAYLDKTYEIHKPRYSCGKCQVAVPCECQRPGVEERHRLPGAMPAS